ncbi:MAG TPA: hypothetical protein VK888_08040, partial [Anaerolineales bacterium]|nr:hypothetical protein [Anaerolineales bacterium]
MNDEIKKNRMSDVTIRLLQPDGTPLARQEMTVAQTRHQFLFGTAAFDLVPLTNGKYQGEAKEQAEERADKLTALFNAATLPFYWAQFEPEPGKPITGQVKNAARWCLEHGLRTK